MKPASTSTKPNPFIGRLFSATWAFSSRGGKERKNTSAWPPLMLVPLWWRKQKQKAESIAECDTSYGMYKTTAWPALLLHVPLVENTNKRRSLWRKYDTSYVFKSPIVSFLALHTDSSPPAEPTTKQKNAHNRTKKHVLPYNLASSRGEIQNGFMCKRQHNNNAPHTARVRVIQSSKTRGETENTKQRRRP